MLVLAVAVKQSFVYQNFSAFLNVQINKKMVDGVCFIKARCARVTCVTSVVFFSQTGKFDCFLTFFQILFPPLIPEKCIIVFILS